MTVKLIMRTASSPNLFRDWMMYALRCKQVSKVVICSGFFQEYLPLHQYALSRDVEFVNALKGVEVITVGVYSKPWLATYQAFIHGLQRQGVIVQAYHTRRLKWHAKIFIAYSGDEPVFAIIGSSNMTRPAFAAPTVVRGDYNYEADVILWNSYKKKENSYFKKFNLEGRNFKNHLNLTYKKDENYGIPLKDRLKDLEDQIGINSDKVSLIRSI